MSLAASRRLLRNRHLRALMGAWTAFYTGDYAYLVLAMVITFSESGALGVGLATACNVLPGGLLGPFTATLATSRRPQLHLAIGIGARAVATFATGAAVLGGSSLSVVLALVAADSLLSAAVRPLHGALVVRLADTTAEAAAANAASSSLLSLSTLVGPALAGAMVGLVSIGWAFALPATIFAAGAVAALTIRVGDTDEAVIVPDRSPEGAAVAQLRAVGAGFRAILASRSAAAATLVFVVNVALVGVWCVASASVASDRLGLGESGITTIMTFYGAGGLLGALATMSLVGRSRLAPIVVKGMSGLGVFLAVIGVLADPVVGAAVAALIGGAGAAAYAVSPTLVQRSVAKAAMVPAAASLQSLYLVAAAAGALLTPLLIHSVGVTFALGMIGVGAIVVTVVLWPILRHGDELSAEDVDKLRVIRTTPSLAPLPGLALEQLARAAARLAVPSGSEVIRQGDRGNRFYMIASGLAEVTVDGRRVATLGPGGSFGEIALLQDVPRSATVVALEDLDLVVVDRAEFLGALSNFAGAVGRIGGSARVRLATPPVEERLIDLDRDVALGGRSVAALLALQPPLSRIGGGAVRELADAARVLAAPDGALITREGDHGDAYYVIVDGGAQVLEGETAVRNIGPGEGFGEQAIVRDVPRTATVRAVGQTTLVAVDRESFERARRAG